MRILTIPLAVFCISLQQGLPVPAWTPLHTGVTARLRGISAAGSRVVWASGAGGTLISKHGRRQHLAEADD